MISMVTPFWRVKKLTEMDSQEWESLCDGCAKCCLHKLEDEDTGDVFYTDIACAYLDHQTCRCKDYTRRQKLVDACIQLGPEDISSFYWLPSTCAYRLLSEGKPLADWHPLISGDPESVHKAGVSVKHRIVAEHAVAEDDYEEHVIRWVD